MLIKIRNVYKPARQKKGQSAVEFALIFPLFILLVLGLVDFGRIFIAYLAMANGAREAARYGGLHWNDAINIRQKVIDQGARSIVTIRGSDISIVYLDGAGAGIIGCWPYASGGGSYVPVASDGTCGPIACPRSSCAQPYPGDSIQITVSVLWASQTLIIQRLLPGGSSYTMKTGDATLIEQ